MTAWPASWMLWRASVHAIASLPHRLCQLRRQRQHRKVRKVEQATPTLVGRDKLRHLVVVESDPEIGAALRVRQRHVNGVLAVQCQPSMRKGKIRHLRMDAKSLNIGC